MTGRATAIKFWRWDPVMCHQKTKEMDQLVSCQKENPWCRLGCWSTKSLGSESDVSTECLPTMPACRQSLQRISFLFVFFLKARPEGYGYEHAPSET